MHAISSIAAAFASAIAVTCASGFGEVATGADATATKDSWKLPDDLLESGNEISFRQSSQNVWYMMKGASLAHDPTGYSLLPDFELKCVIAPPSAPDDATFGVPCWKDYSQQSHHLPIMALNVTAGAKWVAGGSLQIPARTFTMHPSPTGLAIVAWRSPIDGIVGVSGSFSDLDGGCGNGVLWSVDRDGRRFRAGDIDNGDSQSFSITKIRVARGQVLYFTVDPKDGNFFCDTTRLEVQIDRR